MCLQSISRALNLNYTVKMKQVYIGFTCSGSLKNYNNAFLVHTNMSQEGIIRYNKLPKTVPATYYLFYGA